GAGVSATGTGSGHATFVSLATDELVGNLGAGMSFSGAFLRASQVGATINEGFSKTNVESNGFSSDTMCLSGQMTAQIVFDGALAQLNGSDCSTRNANEATCVGTGADHCIFNGGANPQCFYAYWLQGLDSGQSCTNNVTNVISGYAGETGVGSQTGQFATG